MMSTSKEKKPREHVAAIFKEYTSPSRVLQSFTNLSNTVIETALSGQIKFLFEILQNADDSFEDKQKSVAIQFILHKNYLIVQHDGKGFDYNDVERICDYASQIEETKGTDLSKTGYKGLGFKSLFNISDCIYINSNGYSFRFDKTHWPDSSSRPWQVIPIWCENTELPLNKEYSYNQSVNFILRVKKIDDTKKHLKELLELPELLLYLNRIDKISVHFNGQKNFLERKVEKFGIFNKIDIYNNERLICTWLLKAYEQAVISKIQKSIQGGSRFVYPDKIKTAAKVPFTFALRSNATVGELFTVQGLCYCTLPSQLRLTLPYHVNSFFILNLDRTQLHENEWNEFLLYCAGHLQLTLFKDLANVPYLKNYVIQFLVREIYHPYTIFSDAFSRGFNDAKNKTAWLPAYLESRLLKLGEAWIDEAEFFKQNFQNIPNRGSVQQYLIDYDVKEKDYLLFSEAKRFTYDNLFRDFRDKYYPHLTRSSYVDFISYLYERIQCSNTSVFNNLKQVPFLTAKNSKLIPPKSALLEVNENPIPHFLRLNPVDDEFLPSNNINSIKDWLVELGAKRLITPIQILRESLWKWLESDSFDLRINVRNHIQIIDYLATNLQQFTRQDIDLLKEKLPILTEDRKFKLAKLCYLPNTVPITELADIISDEEKVSSCYNMDSLKDFFSLVGVTDRLEPDDVLRRSILQWIRNGSISNKLTKENYEPIIKYASQHSTFSLLEREKSELKKMLVLTCDGSFQKAKDCYFDFALPKVAGLQSVISKNKLVSTHNLSSNVRSFLKLLGVSEEISPSEVLKRSVLRWIKEGSNRGINVKNHLDILKYIYENWHQLTDGSGLSKNELATLKRIPVWTKAKAFKAAEDCYFPTTGEIPGIEDIISDDHFVLLDNFSEEMKRILVKLGVRDPKFSTIYEKYSENLKCKKNVKWFFSCLKKCFKFRDEANNETLLNKLKRKFMSARCLLASNGEMSYSTELYCSRFNFIYEIDNNSIRMLMFIKLPEELEIWLGFKRNLDLACIRQILETIAAQSSRLGEENTLKLYYTLLEQLRLKGESEIQKYQLSLFSKKNKLVLAKNLYYFEEEDKTCHLDSCYLKRYPDMSHEDTLKLAEMCGVNILKFQEDVSCVEEIHDTSLKEYYLDRLPYIAFVASNERSDPLSSTLRSLYEKICTIQVYKCSKISVQYPFGKSHAITRHFAGLRFYTKRSWKIDKSEIHDYLERVLRLFSPELRKTIRDVELNCEGRKQWCDDNETDFQAIDAIEKELHEIRSTEAITLSPLRDGNIDNHDDIEVECEISSETESIADDSSFSDDNSDEYTDKIELDLLPKDKKDHSRDTENNAHESLSKESQQPRKASSLAEVVKSIEFPERIGGKCQINWPGEKLDFEQRPHVNRHLNSEYNSWSLPLTDEKWKTIREGDIWFPGNEEKGNGKGGMTVNKKWWAQGESEIQTNSSNVTVLERRTDILEATGSAESPTTSLDISLGNITQSSVKRQSEMYVFSFLQNHFRQKYPNWELNVSCGRFTLHSQPPDKIEITWLNESERNDQPWCDLMLKRNGEIKWLIAVETIDVAYSSFNLSHHEIVRRIKRLSEEVPQHSDRYCIYLVLNVENSPSALYKVVPLKI